MQVGYEHYTPLEDREEDFQIGPDMSQPFEADNENLWTTDAEYRCVTTNGVLNRRGELIMGAGVALAAKHMFPHLPAKLGKWVKQYGNRAFICQDEKIITLPTKRDWKDPSDIELIKTSLRQVVDIANKYKIYRIAMTRPGCGNGNLRWEDVAPICYEILDGRFTIVNKDIEY